MYNADELLDEALTHPNPRLASEALALRSRLDRLDADLALYAAEAELRASADCLEALTR